MSTLPHLIAIAVAPAAIALGRRRLAPRTTRAVLVTLFATWAVAVLLMRWLLPDPTDIYWALFVFLIVLPGACIPFAAILATWLIDGHRRLVAALLLGGLGWLVGLVLG